jgi:competence protein ComEC
VLHPDTTWAGWGDDVNNDSVVLRLKYGHFEALFAGDAGFPAEARMRGSVGRADLLKVGHHGSRTSSSEPWLEEVHPSVAIVSTGPNRYGHPSAEALGRLERAGAAVWRTDREGTITVDVGPSQMRVQGRQGEVVYPIQ